MNPSLFIGILVILTACSRRPPELICHVNIDEYKLQLAEQFNADSVIIRTVRLKEEPYFPTLKAPKVSIFNPSTETLDYKSLTCSSYVRFENYEEIAAGLKNEAEEVARYIADNCIMTEFNDILIQFLKCRDSHMDHYSFINHFEEIANEINAR